MASILGYVTSLGNPCFIPIYAISQIVSLYIFRLEGGKVNVAATGSPPFIRQKLLQWGSAMWQANLMIHVKYFILCSEGGSFRGASKPSVGSNAQDNPPSGADTVDPQKEVAIKAMIFSSSTGSVFGVSLTILDGGGGS